MSTKVIGDGNLDEQPWYHGMLPRKDIVELLDRDGDWLVRRTERPDGAVKVVITVKWKGDIQHIMLSHDRNGWRMPDQVFPTVLDLVQHYSTTRKALNDTGAKMVRAVRRKNWLVPNRDVQLHAKIGEGNFGEVWSGKLRYKQHWIPVAVKTCKALVGGDQKEEFMREAKIMLQYRHNNVVRLYAVAADKSPLMLVMEHCPEGGLNKYLQRNAGATPLKEKVQFSLHAACGMEYLAVKKNCVHRDLAARNCLLGARKVVKIADFGLTRQGTYKLTNESTTKAVPIKWTAPETLLTGEFTKEGDVWSFGVLMWEIFADGAEPWPGRDLKETFKSVRSGEKMEMPKGCPADIETLMHKCWHLTPANRPTITEVRETLETIVKHY